MIKAYLIPHPPLIVKGVGDGTEIPETRAACEQIGREVREYNPDVAVIISPHSVLYADYFHISPGEKASGSFARFNCAKVKFDVEYDAELAELIIDFAEREKIPAGFDGERDKSLDHGTLVPLYFMNSKRIVRVSLSGLSFEEQYKFGTCIKRAIDKLGRKAVVIASGDMSHKLGGSYGFSQFGVEHDKYVRESIEQSDIRRLFDIDPDVAENAAECGLRSVMIMCGALNGLNENVKSEVLCYEAPYGVGYMTAKFNICEDKFVKLARDNIENYTRFGKTIKVPESLSDEMLENQAGVFVSIKKHGNLRGCIGTIAPTCDNIALEIIQNGVSACSRDPRFNPVTTDELNDLTYSVDVLFPPEIIEDESLLDVEKYGVIVSCGFRRGLLLPNLDGVDTVEEQVRIAMQKGGIRPKDKYILERFEVVRHI